MDTEDMSEASAITEAEKALFMPEVPEAYCPDKFSNSYSIATDRKPPLQAVKTVDEGYLELWDILGASFDFAASGKGHQRHGQDGTPWNEQRHVRIGKALGLGFALGQAMKKVEESTGMDWDAAERELHGAITYLASAILLGRMGVR